MNRTDKILHADDDQKYLKTPKDILHKLKGHLNVITPMNAGGAINVLKKERSSGFSPDSTLPRPGDHKLLTGINRNHPQIPYAIMAKLKIPDVQKIEAAKASSATPKNALFPMSWRQRS